ncbi:hypothetical protein GCM10007052_37630 [Halioglobus japonicus]|nr:hypothetical protein GCM10007052_37630 [Halioglobus japonicus]
MRSQAPRFHRVKAQDKNELEDLVQLISQRVGLCLERQALLEQNTEGGGRRREESVWPSLAITIRVRSPIA